MWKKLIFTGLAVVAALWLGNQLYETWMSGHLYYTWPRVGVTREYSYSNDHAWFVFYFSCEMFSSLCFVLLLLYVGRERPGKARARAPEE
jgi:hypothetical protein